MTKPTRRTFLKTAAVVGGALGSSGFFVAEGTAQETRRPNVACIGIGGKGSSDANNAALFGNIVAICDPDRGRLNGKSREEAFQKAEQYTDYRVMLEKHEKDIDIVIISGPDHMHADATLMAMRMGKHCYTQKPLTRTIYEARLLAEVAKETRVCTQMGNQGTALDTSRWAIDLLKAGIIGTIKEVIVWSNRPVWPQNQDRRDNMESFARKGYAEHGQKAHAVVWEKFNEINDHLQNLDWKSWLNVAQYRDYYPGLYHSFNWRGWWDFGTGALGDMACHMLTVPYAAADLKDPTWVRARSTGHKGDLFPEATIIEFEFPANAERGKIPFWWYDRNGNRPPMEHFAKYGIGTQPQTQGQGGRSRGSLPASGVLIVGEEGALYSTDDYCGNVEYRKEGGEIIDQDAEKWKAVKNKTVLAEKRGNGMDEHNMYELFRAVLANDPSICASNFVDRAGPLTETILLGNLAVWAAQEGGPDGSMGEWGEKVEWDAKNLVVTNLSSLKTPGVNDLIKPEYPDGYRLD